jgi:hypothetical protein
MAQQSSGEFASANPTKGEEMRVQERGIRAKISLNAYSNTKKPIVPLEDNPQIAFGMIEDTLAKLVVIVSWQGFRCDSVSHASPFTTFAEFRGFYLDRDRETQHYYIEDKGGKYIEARPTPTKEG